MVAVSEGMPDETVLLSMPDVMGADEPVVVVVVSAAPDWKVSFPSRKVSGERCVSDSGGSRSVLACSA